MIMKSTNRSISVYLKAGLLSAACLTILLTGCASTRNAKAIETERLLAAAGFQIRLADTPEKLDHLKTLTQRQLVPHQRDDSLYYVYADATACKCLYVGTEKAYQRYQDLLLRKRISDERLEAAEMNQDAELDWGMWGPWGPWY
jgi:hypothetical protein